jgi:hypothetical protein
MKAPQTLSARTIKLEPDDESMANFFTILSRPQVGHPSSKHQNIHSMAGLASKSQKLSLSLGQVLLLFSFSICQSLLFSLTCLDAITTRKKKNTSPTKSREEKKSFSCVHWRHYFRLQSEVFSEPAKECLMEVNHSSPPTHPHTHRQQKGTAWRQRFPLACGRFFRSRLFYDYFLFALGLTLFYFGAAFCVLSAGSGAW